LNQRSLVTSLTLAEFEAIIQAAFAISQEKEQKSGAMNCLKLTQKCVVVVATPFVASLIHE
jgi:hypothetical protein